MRLHHLSVTAFGPFAGTVDVDLDRLSANGLFLLTGPTGAGKTSVLDAVCFALYGNVPGDRADAKRLRSDQADPEVAPEVRLELSLGDRRLRVTRSPAWLRPKRRGDGTTTERVRVLLEERRGDTWTTLATRADEVGDQLGSLLGMNLDQFVQVVMLPQGRFQAFLRSGADERQRLLQRLFRTERFHRVEQWLKDHHARARSRERDAHTVLADLVSRTSETVAEPLPDGWSTDDLAEPAAEGRVGDWATALLTDARHARERADDDVRVRAEEAERCERRWADARREAERADRRRDALRRRHDLAQQETAHADRAERLARAARAQGLGQHDRLARAAGERLRAAEQQADAARHCWAALGLTTEAASPPAWVAVADVHVDRAARLRAVRPQVERLAVATRDLRQTTADLARLGSAAAGTSSPDDLAAAVRASDEAVDESRRAVASLADARERSRAADARLAARHDADRVATEIETARRRHDEARGVLLDARESLVVVREERLAGFAAELAGSLVVGGACPVCGSCQHPAAASVDAGPTPAEAEEQAQRRVDDAASTENVAAEAVRGLEVVLAAREAVAGPDDVDALTAQARAASEAHDALAHLGDALGGRQSALADAERALADAVEASRVHAEQRSALVGTAGALTGEVRVLEATLAEALPDLDPADATVAALDGMVDRAVAAARAARAVAESLEARTARETEAREALAALTDACHEQGFADVEAARAARLDDTEVARLEAASLAHTRALAAVDAVLLELGTDGPTEADTDLAGAERDAGGADVALQRARAHRAVVSSRAERLAELHRLVTDAVDTWRPLHDDARLAARLRALAEGTSADNEWKMRLSAYVLAYRLGQVVEAANVRLAPMTGQRYRLEHSGRRGVHDRRGGLGLLVRDDWSGESRDPATLSGGETFVVSLALALGLADVVGHESGGVRADTLFVDEGFGSLDADTLEQVMDVLDGLRAGGRVVGVVSHVAEMRDRIPTRLDVRPSPRGSTVVAVG